MFISCILCYLFGTRKEKIYEEITFNASLRREQNPCKECSKYLQKKKESYVFDDIVNKGEEK
jgi:hypothetical protein